MYLIFIISVLIFLGKTIHCITIYYRPIYIHLTQAQHIESVLLYMYITIILNGNFVWIPYC